MKRRLARGREWIAAAVAVGRNHATAQSESNEDDDYADAISTNPRDDGSHVVNHRLQNNSREDRRGEQQQRLVGGSIGSIHRRMKRPSSSPPPPPSLSSSSSTANLLWLCRVFTAAFLSIFLFWKFDQNSRTAQQQLLFLQHQSSSSLLLLQPNNNRTRTTHAHAAHPPITNGESEIMQKNNHEQYVTHPPQRNYTSEAPVVEDSQKGSGLQVKTKIATTFGSTTTTANVEDEKKFDNSVIDNNKKITSQSSIHDVQLPTTTTTKPKTDSNKPADATIRAENAPVAAANTTSKGNVGESVGGVGGVGGVVGTASESEEGKQHDGPLPTIICQLSGEMCNQLSHLAHCYLIQLRLHRNYNFQTQILLKRQDNRKWKHARDDVQKCFVKTRSLDFTTFVDHLLSEYELRKQQQQQWLGWQAERFLDGVNNKRSWTTIDQALQYFVEKTRQPPKNKPLLLIPSTTNNEDVSKKTTTTNTVPRISLPFLYADFLVHADIWVDEYYTEIREYFEFDHDKCCNAFPTPNESVFHYRNFMHENPNRGARLFKELSANQTARDVFDHLHPGDHVAMISRYSEQDATEQIHALRNERQFQVRFIDQKLGTQDFCFLMHTQKEMIGYGLSTFLLWAGILAVHEDKLQRVFAYSIVNNERRKTGRQVFLKYNWTNPILQRRFHYKLIKPVD